MKIILDSLQCVTIRDKISRVANISHLFVSIRYMFLFVRNNTYEVYTRTSWFKLRRPKFSLPLMPLAISTQMVNIWYHTDPHEQWKQVTWPVFFVDGLTLSLGANTLFTVVSTNEKASNFSIT